MDLAEIILSQTGARTAAWQSAQARKARASQMTGDALVQLGQELAQVPTLIRKGREEKEIRQVNEAALGGMISGGWDGMRDAALSMPATSPGAQAVKFGHIARWSKGKETAQGLANEAAAASMEREKHEMEKRRAKGQENAVGAYLRGGPPALRRVEGLQLRDAVPLLADDRVRDMAAQRDAANAKNIETKGALVAAENDKKLVARNAEFKERIRKNMEDAGIKRQVEQGKTDRQVKSIRAAEMNLDKAITSREAIANSSNELLEKRLEFSTWFSENKLALAQHEESRADAKTAADFMRVSIKNAQALRTAVLLNDPEADTKDLDETIDGLQEDLDGVTEHLQTLRRTPTQITPAPEPGLRIPKGASPGGGKAPAEMTDAELMQELMGK